jgi:hypothetical protein
VSTQLPPLNQPGYIKLINSLGGHLRRSGFVKPELRTELLMRRAQKITGLRNFGDESFREGLEVLTMGLRDEAQLSQLGQIAAYYNLVDQLCVRLKLIDYRAQRPEVKTEAIRQPLFITGLPRTGSTIIYELIAQDPGFRSPATWEVAKPIPPAMADSFETDKRIKPVNRALALLEQLSPGFNAIHAIGATLPQECVYILASHFISEQFGYMYHVPKYRAWSLEQDMTQAYQWHANFLQHLQVDYKRDRWVLKAPAHLAYLKYLLAQYPDAAIVWTHRRPLDAVSSFSSLATHLQGGFSRSVDPLVVGDHQARHFAKMMHKGMEQRDALDHGQFLDVSFSAICSNPINVVRDIYAHFGMNFSSEAEGLMQDYLKRRPRDLYGVHKYRSADFGLDESQEKQLFPEYLQKYGKYLI